MLDGKPLLQRCKTVFRLRSVRRTNVLLASIVRFCALHVRQGFQYETPSHIQEMASLGQKIERSELKPAISSSSRPAATASATSAFSSATTPSYTPLSPKHHRRQAPAELLRQTIRRSRPCARQHHPRPAFFFQATGKPCSVKRTAILKHRQAALYFSGFIVPSCPDYAFRNKCLPHQLLAGGRSVSLRISMFRAKNQTSSCVSR